MKPNTEVNGRRVTELETKVAPEADALREAVELSVLKHAAALATEVVELRALNAELTQLLAQAVAETEEDDEVWLGDAWVKAARALIAKSEASNA